MTTATISPRKAEKERQAWLAILEELALQVETWAKNRGWAVQREEKPIHESRLGDYVAPVVSVLAPAGRVQIDPVARFAARSDGRVDLIAWPSLSRMLLIRSGDTWKLKTDSGVEWPQKWSPKAFEHLVKVLNADS